MINAIGLKNFRSIKDITINGGYIDLKPFTVLLGKNSSGKSTFLRLFPLLKQSVSGRTRGALALYGDEVDFGDFDTLVSCDSDNKHDDYVELRFKGQINRSSGGIKICYDSFVFEKEDPEVFPYEVKLKIKNNSDNDYPYISEFILIFFANEIKFVVNDKNEVKEFYINDFDFLSNLGETFVEYSIQRPGFPVFGFENTRLKSLTKYCKPLLEQIYDSNKLTAEYLDLIRFLFSSITDKETLKEKYKKMLKSRIKSFMNGSAKKTLKKIIDDEESFELLYRNYLFLNFESIYDIFTSDIIDDFLSSSYSKPLRANADRYYRSRTLYIKEINSDGSNLVEYYTNLSLQQKKDFKQWMEENFNFYYEVEKSGGYKSILIHEGKVKHNITDMGFGFSQILPIITQLWVLLEKKNKQQRRIIFSIEQPELHLHPALQNKLIKALVKIAAVGKENDLNISFIIETHSETIVNKLGCLVAQQQIGSDDIQVLIFSKEKPDSFSKIETSTFDKNGELTNWPIGFFGDDE